MTTIKPRYLTAGVLGAALAVLSVAPSAQAAAGTDLGQRRDTAVSVGQLVLEPTERGYRGSLPMTVTYRGREAPYVSLTIREPVAGSLAGSDPEFPCFYGNQDEQLRREIHCTDITAPIQPGERRQYRLHFEVLTTPRAFAMSVAGGTVTVETQDSRPERVSKAFGTVFRSTTGSVRDPRPYVQDLQTDASVTVGAARLVRQEDGSYLGGLPVTVRYDGDAPHDALFLDSVLPAGVRLWGIKPEAVCAFPWCEVPGGEFMQGEQRSMELLFTAPAGAVPGNLGTGTVQLGATFFLANPSDVDPSDNTASFTITAIDDAV